MIIYHRHMEKKLESEEKRLCVTLCLKKQHHHELRWVELLISRPHEKLVASVNRANNWIPHNKNMNSDCNVFHLYSILIHLSFTYANCTYDILFDHVIVFGRIVLAMFHCLFVQLQFYVSWIYSLSILAIQR